MVDPSWNSGSVDSEVSQHGSARTITIVVSTRWQLGANPLLDEMRTRLCGQDVYLHSGVARPILFEGLHCVSGFRCHQGGERSQFPAVVLWVLLFLMAPERSDVPIFFITPDRNVFQVTSQAMASTGGFQQALVRHQRVYSLRPSDRRTSR